MECKQCGKHASYCSERWINKNAMIVDYWCWCHAPKGAEYYGIFSQTETWYFLGAILLLIAPFVGMFIKWIVEVYVR